MRPVDIGLTRADSSPNAGRVLTLRPYQDRIVRWGVGEAPDGKGMWAVDLGLGKTAAALALVQQSMWDRFDTDRWLVVAPKLVAQDTWPTQLLTWGEFRHLDWRRLVAGDFELTPAVVMARDGEEQTVHAGDVARLQGEGWIRLAKSGLRLRDRASVKRRLQGYNESLHIVSWDFLPFLVQAWGQNWPYDGVIIDESTFAQSSTGVRHRALWQVIQRLQRVSRVVELTGLPTPNGREAMHGQIRLLDGGERLGRTKTEFMDRWMIPDRMDKRNGRVWSWQVNPALQSKMDEAVRDIAVSLSSDDYLTLPALVPNDVPITLPMPARTAYAALERDLFARVGADSLEVVAASQGVLVGKLLQVCNGAVYTDGDKWALVHEAKFDYLADLLEAATEPVIVVYSYGHDRVRLQSRFKLPDVSQTGVLAKFKRGELTAMCGHPGSFGFGVDGLQSVCHQVVWIGATYNLEHWIQVLKRVYRDGQQRPVIITRLLAAGTLEENIAQVVIPGKREAADALTQAVRLRVSASNVG